MPSWKSDSAGAGVATAYRRFLWFGEEARQANRTLVNLIDAIGERKAPL